MYGDKNTDLIKTLVKHLLIEQNTHVLPVDALKIIKENKNLYIVHDYKYLSDFYPDDLDMLTELKRSPGVIIFNKKCNLYFCYYDGELPESQKNWIAACFIACVELDILHPDTQLHLPCNDGGIEEFALNLLSPDFILSSSGIQDVDSIIQRCSVPFQKAHKIHKRLNAKNKKYTTPFESILFKRFKDYIKHYT